jgi:hypothetical protein
MNSKVRLKFYIGINIFLKLYEHLFKIQILRFNVLRIFKNSEPRTAVLTGMIIVVRSE